MNVVNFISVFIVLFIFGNKKGYCCNFFIQFYFKNFTQYAPIFTSHTYGIIKMDLRNCTALTSITKFYTKKQIILKSTSIFFMISGLVKTQLPFLVSCSLYCTVLNIFSLWRNLKHISEGKKYR